jgi:hypothetical protein
MPPPTTSPIMCATDQPTQTNRPRPRRHMRFTSTSDSPRCSQPPPTTSPTMCATYQPTPTTQSRPRRHLRLHRDEPQPRARPGHGASQPRNGRPPVHRPPTIQPPTTCPSAAHLPAIQPLALPPAPRLALAEVSPRAVHALRLPLQPARGERLLARPPANVLVSTPGTCGQRHCGG